MSTIEETNIKIPNTLFKYIEEFSQTIHDETQIDYNYLYQSIYDLIVNNKYVNNNEEFPSIIENCPQDKISFIVFHFIFFYPIYCLIFLVICYLVWSWKLYIVRTITIKPNWDHNI